MNTIHERYRTSYEKLIVFFSCLFFFFFFVTHFSIVVLWCSNKKTTIYNLSCVLIHFTLNGGDIPCVVVDSLFIRPLLKLTRLVVSLEGLEEETG